MKEVFAMDKPPEYDSVLPSQATKPRFQVGVPFDLDASWKSLRPLARPYSFLSGYPVRPEFLAEPDPEALLALKRSLLEDLPGVVNEDRKIVLVMTGGGGQTDPRLA